MGSFLAMLTNLTSKGAGLGFKDCSILDGLDSLPDGVNHVNVILAVRKKFHDTRRIYVQTESPT